MTLRAGFRKIGITGWGLVEIIKDPDDASNNVLEVNPNGASESHCYVTGYMDLTDYTVEAKVRSLGGFGQERAGLIARGTNNSSFYQLEISIDVGLFELDDPAENWGRLASVPAEIESDMWYAIKFTCEDNHLMGYINGEKIIDVFDKTNPHPNRFFGVRTWASHAIYDDFKVYDKGGASLEAFGKLATAWGEIRSRH